MNIDGSAKCSAEFVAKDGNIWQIHGKFSEQDILTIVAMDNHTESVISFCLWPGDGELGASAAYPDFHSVSGAIVSEHRQGVASAMYKLGHLFFNQMGKRISPSDNVTEEGKAMWQYFDPSIEWEFQENKGSYHPVLTQHSPP